MFRQKIPERRVREFLSDTRNYRDRPLLYKDVLDQALAFLREKTYNEDLAEGVKFAMSRAMGVEVKLSDDKGDEDRIYLTSDILVAHRCSEGDMVRVRRTDYEYSIPLILEIHPLGGEYSVKLYRTDALIIGGKRAVEKLYKGESKPRESTWMMLALEFGEEELGRKMIKDIIRQTRFRKGLEASKSEE